MDIIDLNPEARPLGDLIDIHEQPVRATYSSEIRLDPS